MPTFLFKKTMEWIIGKITSQEGENVTFQTADGDRTYHCPPWMLEDVVRSKRVMIYAGNGSVANIYNTEMTYDQYKRLYTKLTLLQGGGL